MNERTGAEPVTIPVPGGDEMQLSGKVEFNGCTLNLTHVKKMPEPMKTGMVTETASDDESGDTEVKKPALYVTAGLESRDPKKEAVMVTGYEEDPLAQPYERMYLQGDSRISVIFADPVYYWHKDIELPVQ